MSEGIFILSKGQDSGDQKNCKLRWIFSVIAKKDVKTFKEQEWDSIWNQVDVYSVG